jgi:hypothetical protein
VRVWVTGKGYVDSEALGDAQRPAVTAGAGRGAARRSGTAAPLVVGNPDVRLVVGGRVETVPAFRAARLLATNAASLPADLTRKEAEAILAAHEDRTRRQVEALERDGLLIGAGQRR